MRCARFDLKVKWEMFRPGRFQLLSQAGRSGGEFAGNPLVARGTGSLRQQLPASGATNPPTKLDVRQSHIPEFFQDGQQGLQGKVFLVVQIVPLKAMYAI